MSAADLGHLDAAPWSHERPATQAERDLVAATMAVYRQQRQGGEAPADAWARVTDLCDDALVRPVMRGEHRLGIKAT